MQNRQLASWQYWLGNDGARPVLRQTVSRAVSSMEQPPATNTSLLEQSTPQGSLDSFSSGQHDGAASSNTQAVNYTEQFPAIISLAGTRTMAY